MQTTMKKIKTLIILSLILFVGGQMMAQTRGHLFLGATFPLGDFSDFDGFEDFALIHADEHDGGAGIGFSAGFRWYFNVGVEGLGVMLSVDGFYNGPNPDLKEAYRRKESSSGNQWLGGSFDYKSTPKFVNVPLMLGLNYIYYFNPHFGIFAEAGAGGNLRFITEMETVGTVTALGLDTQITTTQKYDNVFSFAYQAGLGMEVAKNLVIGFSFYDFGKGLAKGDETVRRKILSSDTSTKETYYKEYGTVRPMMFLARIGFTF